MHDRYEAPDPGVMGHQSPQSGETPWPADLSEWPALTASSLEWARFYLHRLNFHDLRPTPSQHDRDLHARYIAAEAEEGWRWEHTGQDLPLDLYAQWLADAKLLANGVRGPIPKIAGQHRGRSTTDADLVRWFTPAKGKEAPLTQHHLERGVCVNLGGSFDRLVQIDVDPRRGGSIAGEYACADGMRISTPGGGIHVFAQVPPGVTAHHSDGALAPGVEVRVAGWALLPCGAATPGRVVINPGPAEGLPPPHPALLRPAPRVTRPRAEGAVTVDASGRPLGRCATIIASEIGRGDGRTQAAGTIIGMLARPEGLPADVVDALAALLVEYGAAHDWPAPRVREELTRWRELLTRGPRDSVFAAEVLETWITVRDIGPVRKGAGWARATARSIWKSADRREEGQAGAEDLGHVGAVADYQPAPRAVDAPAVAGVDHVAPPPAETPNDSATRMSDYVLHGPVCPCDACKAMRVEVKDQARDDHEAFLRRILPFSADAYPDDVADKDMERVPLRIDALYPFRDFWTVAEERTEETEWAGVVTGHGYGRHMARAVGGLLPGSMVVVGGAGAKIGKTHLVGQAVEGLALDAAARILGIPGYQDKPIVMVTWVTEMPKPGEVKYRMMARLFGFDAAALASSAAPEAPGIIHMAEEGAKRKGELWTPLKVVERARAIVRGFRAAEEVPSMAGGHEKNPVAFYLKYLQTEVRLSEFPAPTGQGRSYVDQASGTNLVGHLADGIMLRRRELAQRIGVAEDKITPIVVIDPGQRFIGGGESGKRELDAFLLAVQSRLCFAANGVGAVVLMTSDTTKDAVANMDYDTFMSEESQRLAARIFAGSQAWMHIPDTVIAVASADTGVSYRRTQYVRVLMTRNGANDKQVYPFMWETYCGRFRARAPEPLRDPKQAQEGGRTGGSAHSKGGNRSWSPPGKVADHDGPPAPFPRNTSKRHVGFVDD